TLPHRRRAHRAGPQVGATGGAHAQLLHRAVEEVTTVPIIRESDRLLAAVEALWQSVCEVALTALEDRPGSADLAVVDDVCDRVLDLQGAIAVARDLLAADPSPSGANWPEIAARLDQARTMYWQLCSHDAESKVRQAIRPGGTELRAWHDSLRAG